MSTKISENTNIQLDLKTVIAIIMVTASFVGMYYTLQADIEEAKKLPPIEVTRLEYEFCLLYTSPSPRDRQKSRMPSSA